MTKKGKGRQKCWKIEVKLKFSQLSKAFLK